MNKNHTHVMCIVYSIAQRRYVLVEGFLWLFGGVDVHELVAGQPTVLVIDRRLNHAVSKAIQEKNKRICQI
jgi:hypothetical protein